VAGVALEEADGREVAHALHQRSVGAIVGLSVDVDEKAGVF
jgi:hypothetical protein